MGGISTVPTLGKATFVGRRGAHVVFSLNRAKGPGSQARALQASMDKAHSKEASDE